MSDLISQIVDHVVGETLIGGRQTGAMIVDGTTATEISQFKTLLAAKLREAVAAPSPGGGVESVTGDLVDGTDPLNPVVDLPGNVTTQGNSFNSASQLVQLDGDTKLPAVDGSQLTNLPAVAAGIDSVLAQSQQLSAIRTVDLNGNDLIFFNTGGFQFKLRPSSNIVEIVMPTQGEGQSVFRVTGGNAESVEFISSGNATPIPLFKLDRASHQYYAGDINGIDSGDNGYWLIDDANHLFTVNPGGSVAGRVKINGGLILQYRTDSGGGTIQGGDNVLYCNGTIGVLLHAASDCAGQVYTIKNIGSGTVTISTDGGNIDGVSEKQLTVQYTAITVQSDGSNWWIIGKV